MSKKPFDIKDYIKNNKFKLESEPKTGKHISKGYNDIRKTMLNEVKINEKGEFDLQESLRGDGKKQMSEETKRHFLEIISTYNTYREQLNRKSDLVEVSQTLGSIVEAAKHMTLEEADDWFDKVTIKRNMKQLENLDKEFDKIANEAKSLDTRMLALYEDMGHILNRYFEVSDINEDEMNRRLGKKQVKEDRGDYEHGFDLTEISAPKFKAILKKWGFQPKPKKTNRGWVWKGKHGEIVTANNPITGEYYNGSREPEKNYASYIGITGKEDVVKEVVSDIKRHADYIKGESKGKRDFI